MTAVIIISGFIKIPMYPVPVSAVFLTINFIALSFDREISVFSVLTYLIVGLLGLPVFSGGGGIGYVFSPSFGYLIGFLFVCLCADELKKMNFLDKSIFFKKLLISVINMVLVYFCGALYGYYILKIYSGAVIDIGYILFYYVVIFIPGDLLSSVLSSYISKRVNTISTI